MIWVLDASVVLSRLKAEPGAQRVEDILADGEAVLIDAVSLIAIRYHLARVHEQAPRTALERRQAAGDGAVRVLNDDFRAMAVWLGAHYSPIALGEIVAVG
jgi:uncharacterized protein with PIN domain